MHRNTLRVNDLITPCYMSGRTPAIGVPKPRKPNCCNDLAHFTGLSVNRRVVGSSPTWGASRNLCYTNDLRKNVAMPYALVCAVGVPVGVPRFVFHTTFLLKNNARRESNPITPTLLGARYDYLTSGVLTYPAMCAAARYAPIASHTASFCSCVSTL